jgi:hypothetical protein
MAKKEKTSSFVGVKLSFHQHFLFMTSNFPTTLALIPARGGSKSIPRKNLKSLGGFPLIAYSIAAGL